MFSMLLATEKITDKSIFCRMNSITRADNDVVYHVSWIKAKRKFYSKPILWKAPQVPYLTLNKLILLNTDCYRNQII